MNSTVINGTPRPSSMAAVDASLTNGSSERRPSARAMPIGSENTIPTSETTRVTRMPPHRSVETCGRPSVSAPTSKAYESGGSTTEEIHRARALGADAPGQQPDDPGRGQHEEQHDPPALRQRIAAKDEVAQLGVDEGPAGAVAALRDGCLAGLRGVAGPGGVEHRKSSSPGKPSREWPRRARSARMSGATRRHIADPGPCRARPVRRGRPCTACCRTKAGRSIVELFIAAGPLSFNQPHAPVVDAHQGRR